MASAAGVALPHPLVSLRPPPQLLAVSTSFRRLSLSTSSRRSTHFTSLIARSSADGEAATTGDPEPAATTDAEAAVDNDAAAAPEGEVEEKPPRKPIVKFGDVIGILNKQFIEEAEKVKPVPDLRPGDIIELRMQRPNKRRLSLYRGIVISKQSSGVHTTIRVRRIIAGIGVEIVFPVYSPRIKEIKVVKHRKVRRAKLYYLREKLPRFSTFK